MIFCSHNHLNQRKRAPFTNNTNITTFNTTILVVVLPFFSHQNSHPEGSQFVRLSCHLSIIPFPPRHANDAAQCPSVASACFCYSWFVCTMCGKLMHFRPVPVPVYQHFAINQSNNTARKRTEPNNARLASEQRRSIIMNVHHVVECTEQKKNENYNYKDLSTETALIGTNMEEWIVSFDLRTKLKSLV